MGDINEEYRRYSTHLGHLFASFARMETLLMGTLKLYLTMNIGGLEDSRSMQLASAIFGSMRFRATRDMIKRVMDADGAPKERVATISNTLEHLTHIEALRDKLAHQLVTPAHGDLGAFWQVSDHTMTRNIKGLKVWVFDTLSVAHAAHDLVVAADFLGSLPASNYLFSQIDLSSPPTWRYKPSMLKLVPHNKLRTPPAP